MKKIKAQKILFIKLGQGGEYEEECIKNNTLKLGFRKVDHNLCKNGKWEEIKEYFINKESTTKSSSTNQTNQIKQFYEEDESTLWVTFYANKLWWCFSKPIITQQKDKTKTRPVINKWSDKDISGNVLLLSNISGKLLKTQGFRGTICKVQESDYAIKKINCEQLREVVEVEKALSNLQLKLALLIQNIQWKDFETLIDLIFRQAGWQRISDKGKTQKTLDLELLSPVTGEKAIVQIKAQSNLKEFLKYQEEFSVMNDYSKFFYVVHTADENLKNYQNETETIIYLNEKISELTISSGLIEWVIKKTS